MRPALALLTVLAAGAWAVGWPRRRSRARILRRIYRNLDELLGVRRFENDRRATLRHYWKPFLGRDLTDLLWPVPQLGGAAALPPTRRQARYVHVHWPPQPWPRACRRHQVRVVTLGPWTSEADITPAFFDRAERKLAQALSLEHAPGMFERAVDWPRDRVTLTLTVRVHVPDDLRAAEDLEDA
ncbi:MAG TPA: hypothetical protein VG276_26395 [Actinomycetes bacterium]|jgi:hypothetical protein|nr:hypothetical protein [Actinomycetes bacterium]